MFNNNVAHTYNFQDASQEIVIMLLGAFLLGALLTWLLSKLFNKDYTHENNAYRYENQSGAEINSLKQSTISQAKTTSEVRIVDKPTNPIKKITVDDDLTKISGIDSEMQTALKKIGITSFTDLRDIDNDELTKFQQQQQKHKREIETWPHQAGLAAKGDWNKLKDYQGFIQRVQVASHSTKATNLQDADDLTKLVGVSPKIQSVLNNKDISTFKQLSHIDADTLKKHILEADEKFVENEAESWPHQAAMAEKGQWEELKIYQEFMHADSEDETSGLKIPEVKEVVKSKSVNEKKSVEQVKPETGNKKTQIKTSFHEEFNDNLSDHDDLKRIEGIGPKIEEVLNNGGIYTFSQLYNSDRTRLKKLLDEAGNQFKMHDPESWPHQAGMANRGEWDELKTYQNSITKEQKASIAKAEKASNKANEKASLQKTTKLNKESERDDLRKIEGIGPKIQELLNNAGIHTFKALSEQSRDYIKALLNEAGPQFRMHEPESWPHQAKLAANEEWQELEEYQDFLISGRE